MSETSAAASASTQPAAAAAPAAPAATTAAPAADGSLLDTGAAKPAPSTETPAAAATDTKPAVAAPAPDATPAAATAPETYDLKVPKEIALSDTVMSEFSTVAKGLGLTQDAAQKIIGSLAPKIAEANVASIESYRAELVAQSKADKEFGGDKLNENLAIAKKGLDAVGTPKLRELLNQSGLGDHPEIIRAFIKIGTAISEDKFVPGGKAPTAGETSAATRLYGKK